VSAPTDEPWVICDVPGCDGLTVTDGMVERGTMVLLELLGDVLGTDQELEQMAWAVLTAALRVRRPAAFDDDGVPSAPASAPEQQR
jgi:hypothetical protein